MSIWNIFKRPVKTNIDVGPEVEPIEGIITDQADALVDLLKEMDKISYPPVPDLDLVKVKWVPSPNKSNRRGAVKYIVLHHTGPGSFGGIVKWLCDPQAKASAHYVVGKNGELNQLVSTTKESWHAGLARWCGEKINNHRSIGIEICNYGVLQKGEDGAFYYNQGRHVKKYTGKVEPVLARLYYPSAQFVEGWVVPYPEKQKDKLVSLCRALVAKYPEIKDGHILTHADVAIPEGRKNDPFGLDLDEIVTRIFQQ